MQDNRNVIIAAVLAMAILFGWQYFIAGPQLEQAQRDAEYAAAQQQSPRRTARLWPRRARRRQPARPTRSLRAQRQPTSSPPAKPRSPQAPRVTIDTSNLAGSINLIGGRIDDLSLKSYHETIEKGLPDHHAAVARRRPGCLFRRAGLGAHQRRRHRGADDIDAMDAG